MEARKLDADGEEQRNTKWPAKAGWSNGTVSRAKCMHLLLRCLPSFVCGEKSPSLSLVDNEAECCLLTELFSVHRFPLPGTKGRKTTLAESCTP